MNDLHSEIVTFLMTHARGRENAIPRRKLRNYLIERGFNIGDRTLRRAYAKIATIGYSCRPPKGLYWILTPEDQRIATAHRHAQAMACLEHESRTRRAGQKVGQMELPL